MSEDEECVWCDGTGYTKCEACLARHDEDDHEHDDECELCNGTGELFCDECDGEGTDAADEDTDTGDEP